MDSGVQTFIIDNLSRFKVKTWNKKDDDNVELELEDTTGKIKEGVMFKKEKGGDSEDKFNYSNARIGEIELSTGMDYGRDYCDEVEIVKIGDVKYSSVESKYRDGSGNTTQLLSSENRTKARE